MRLGAIITTMWAWQELKVTSTRQCQMPHWMSIPEQSLDGTLFGKREIRIFNPGPQRIQIETLKYL